MDVRKHVFTRCNFKCFFGFITCGIFKYFSDCRDYESKIKESIQSFVGGILMGFGSMIALDCGYSGCTSG